jgi:hypothetical protein
MKLWVQTPVPQKKKKNQNGIYAVKKMKLKYDQYSKMSLHASASISQY